MIIYGLLSLIISLISVLLAPLPDVPAMPDQVAQFLSDAVGYIESGFSLFYAFCYGDVVVLLLTISIAVLVLYEGWRFIMFVLRKIPMLGIN